MSKPLNEQQSRARLLGWARKYGAEEQLKKIFARYDDLLKGCKSQEERQAVAAAGIVEIHDFFGGKDGELTIDGKRIR